MPVCTLHLLVLSVPLMDFLDVARKLEPEPLVISRVVRWVVTPTTLSVDPLLIQQPQWDVLVVLPSSDKAVPTSLLSKIKRSFVVQAGVPSKIVSGWANANRKLLYPPPSDVPALTGSLKTPNMAPNSQALELSHDLQQWMRRWDPHNTKGAVSMLNLLAFKEGLHEEYLKYGKAFAESIGSSRGGVAKIVGKVIASNEATLSDETQHDGGKDGWDEVALAHYPTLQHFADMLASDDYQKVNKKHRVGSLKDTCILCTSELYWEDEAPPKL